MSWNVIDQSKVQVHLLRKIYIYVIMAFFLCFRPSFDKISCLCEALLLHLEHNMALTSDLCGDPVAYHMSLNQSIGALTPPRRNSKDCTPQRNTKKLSVIVENGKEKLSGNSETSSASSASSETSPESS